MPVIPSPSTSRRPREYADPNWPDFTTTLENGKLPQSMIHQHKKKVEAIAAIADQIRWTCSQMKPEYWPDEKTTLATQFFMSNIVQLRIVCYEPIMAIRKHINKNCRELMDLEFGLRDTTHWLMPAKVRQVESPIADAIEIPEWKKAQDERERKEAERAARGDGPETLDKSASKTPDEQSSPKSDKKSSKAPPEPERTETEEEKLDTKKLKAALFFEKEDEIEAHQQKVNIFVSEQLGHFEYELPEMNVGQTWEDALRSTIRTYDAAEMELERHYRLIRYTKTKSQWPLDRLDVLRARKAIPTRSNQELLLEIALQYELGSPNPKTQEVMKNWTNETDVRNSLRIHLGRFRLPGDSRHWTNYFTHGIDHPSGAEPAMFFICQHKYNREAAKWVVGGTTPLTGVDQKVKWKWADEFYKSVREQGMGSDWVDHVKMANDRQRALERQLMGPPGRKPNEDLNLAVRRQVLATLRADPGHQRLVARVTCKGLSIDRSMVPTQCCYRCQCNFQYIVLSAHMSMTDTIATDHLRTYSWTHQCGWDQQCAEASAACQCTHFDDKQAELNRPSSSRLKVEGRKTLSKKKSTAVFTFKR